MRTSLNALIVPVAMAALLCMHGPVMARDNTPGPGSLRDTILISKANTSKRHKIKLYPNADHRVLFFSAAGEQGRVYQLYLFDMDGKLSKQIQIRNKETTVLTNIIKGDYLFEVFSDDERIENGQVSIR